MNKCEKAIIHLEDTILNTVLVIQAHFKAIEKEIKNVNKECVTCKLILEEESDGSRTD